MNRNIRDNDWLYRLYSETHVFVKYVCHKENGTTLDIIIPPQGRVIYIPFIIGKLPVTIIKIIRPRK